MSTAASPRPSSTPSRLAPARRRARLLKIASAGVAVAGFGVVSLLVRSGTHTGSTASTSTPTSSGNGALELSSRISQEAADGSSFFGSGSDSGSSSGSVTPSQSSSPPQASTRTS